MYRVRWEHPHVLNHSPPSTGPIIPRIDSDTNTCRGTKNSSFEHVDPKLWRLAAVSAIGTRALWVALAPTCPAAVYTLQYPQTQHTTSTHHPSLHLSHHTANAIERPIAALQTKARRRGPHVPPRRASITMHHPAYQNQYHQQPDWQHLPQAAHNQYAAQTQAAAAANAAAQQQNYGRTMSAAGQHGGNTNPLANATNGNGNGINNHGGPLGGSGGPGDHNGGSIIGPGDNITEDNRRVLEWIAQVLNANTREAALLELSK